VINDDRLMSAFKSLVAVDSVSKQEQAICNSLKVWLEALGATVVIDGAAAKTGGNSGNLIARFAGNVDAPALLLNAHMDTVEPGRGVRPTLENGVFKSCGDTILGADDKSGIAILIEVMHAIKEAKQPHGPIELVFTVCEEVGLLGAKNLDYSLISAKTGFSLDSRDTEAIITQAPAANKLEFSLHGKDAHAGTEPERGINAISLASKAIAALELGRIDPETTCNIGMIQGGIATNIIPNLVSVKGEVRSHDEAKLQDVTSKIVAAFTDVTEDYKSETDSYGLPRIDCHIEGDFPRLFIPNDHPVVGLAEKAAGNLGRKLVHRKSGGGSDANIFYSKGLFTPVLGTGMRDVHTTRESIQIDDMVRSAELVLEIIAVHAEK
jgi:tripeptide aminopeptidase